MELTFLLPAAFLSSTFGFECTLNAACFQSTAPEGVPVAWLKLLGVRGPLLCLSLPALPCMTKIVRVIGHRRISVRFACSFRALSMGSSIFIVHRVVSSKAISRCTTSGLSTCKVFYLLTCFFLELCRNATLQDWTC